MRKNACNLIEAYEKKKKENLKNYPEGILLDTVPYCISLHSFAAWGMSNFVPAR